MDLFHGTQVPRAMDDLGWQGNNTYLHHPITDNPGLSAHLMPGESKAAKDVCKSKTGL